MENAVALTLGEKIRLIRKAKGFNQTYVAHVTKTSDMFISRIERGEAECSSEILTAIKKALDIPNAPLYDNEREVYMNRLLMWNDMISNYRLSEAREYASELFPIYVLPFERRLSALYHTIKARLCGVERDFSKLEKTINEAEAYLDDGCNLALHLYHRNKGMHYWARFEYKNALKHFLKALNIQDANIKLDATFLSAIGHMYLCLGIPVQAMIFYERAKTMYGDDRLHPGVHNTNLGIATLYVQLGELTKAKKIFDDALVRARSNNDEEGIMLGTANMCAISIRMGDFKEALPLSEQSLKYGRKNMTLYFLALYNNAICLIELKMFDQAAEKIQDGKILADGNEHFSFLFESLGHLMTLKDNSDKEEKKISSDYIENVAIPYYVTHEDSQIRFAGIDICKTLETYYKKKGATKKAQAITTILRDIYEKMFFVDSEKEFLGE